MEETVARPKPMVEVGGKPILWHIMKIYSHYGINDLVICLGYRGYLIKEYFANYALDQNIYAAEIGDCGTFIRKARCTDSPRRLFTRQLHEAAPQRIQARALPELMRLRRCVVEHPFPNLECRNFEKPRFLPAGRWGPAPR